MVTMRGYHLISTQVHRVILGEGDLDKGSVTANDIARDSTLSCFEPFVRLGAGFSGWSYHICPGSLACWPHSMLSSPEVTVFTSKTKYLSTLCSILTTDPYPRVVDEWLNSCNWVQCLLDESEKINEFVMRTVLCSKRCCN